MRNIGMNFCVVIVVWLGAANISHGQEPAPFNLDLRRQAYPLLEEEGATTLGAELKIGIYGPDATIDSLEQIMADMDDEAKLAIPEHIIAKEFELILGGELEAILDLYHGQESKQYARMIYSDMRATQQFHRDNIRGIKFLTKAEFGPLVRIRYKRIAKDPNGFSPPWAAYLREYDGRYYLVKGVPDHPFQTAVEGFPYWTPVDRRQVVVDDDVTTLRFFHPDSDPDHDDSFLRLFCDIYRFPDQTMVLQQPPDARRHRDVTRFIQRMVEAYRQGQADEILNLWPPNQREVVEFNLIENEAVLQTQIKYFSGANDFQLEFLVSGDDGVWVYLRPVYPQELGPLKLIPLLRTQGKLYLATEASAADAHKILTSNEMAKVLRDQLEDERAE